MTTNPQKNTPLPSVTPLPSDLVLIRSELKELKDEILESRKQVFVQVFFGTVFSFVSLFLTFGLINNASRTDPSLDQLTNQMNEQNRKTHEIICQINPDLEQCK